MRGRLLNLLTAVSLLLCAAALALGVRSVWTCDQVNHPGGRTLLVVASARGRVHMQVIRINRPMWVASWDWQTLPAAAFARPNDTGWRFAGFDADRGAVVPSPFGLATQRIYTVPHWFLAAATGAPALVCLRTERRRRRIDRRNGRGECSACGYDLRATSDRCPECGNAVSRA